MNSAKVPATDRYEANAIFAGACGSEDFYAGISEIAPLTIYPNPVEDELHLSSSFGKMRYKLYDIQGRILDEGSVEQDVISLPNIPPGLYFITLGDNLFRIKKQ